MGDGVTADYEQMQSSGSAIASAGYAITDLINVDVSDNGNDAITAKVAEFAMYLRLTLRAAADEAVDLGHLATAAAAEWDAVDGELGGETP